MRDQIAEGQAVGVVGKASASKANVTRLTVLDTVVTYFIAKGKQEVVVGVGYASL